MAVQIYYQLIRDIVIDEQLLSMLQPQRRKQLFSFRLESDQKRCAAAGLLLWKHIYNKHPERFTVSYNAAGKPSVANAPFFNLSHSNDFVMLAVSDTPVGCDIEKLHKTVLSHHVFHPNELDALSNLPSGDIQNHEFLRLWTAKEAFLKAIGTGIDAKASSYDFSKSNTISLYDGHFGNSNFIQFAIFLTIFRVFAINACNRKKYHLHFKHYKPGVHITPALCFIIQKRGLFL